MKHSIEVIRSDFDKIALLSKDEIDYNSTYYAFLLKQIPLRCDNSLEIGCGTGGFSRLLAARSGQVTAIDVAPNMIRVAKDRSHRYANINFQTLDVLDAEFSSESFDCIVSIATLHHLPIEETLEKMKRALKTGGTLIIHDLFQPDGLIDAARSAAALPISILLRLLRTGRLRPEREVREAWREHCLHDHYPTMAEVDRFSREITPGAKLIRHLLWRYSIIWNKPRL